MSKPRFWFFVALLSLIACVKRGLIFCLGPAAAIGDQVSYWRHGEMVADGNWLLLGSPEDFRTPLYPMFLGLFQHLLGPYALMGVVIAQHMLLFAAGLLVAYLVCRLTGSRTATLLAYAWLVSCQIRPWFCNTVLTEPLFTLFLIGSLGALIAYHRNPDARWAAAFASLLAITTLVRPVPKLLWIPLLALFFLHATPWVARRVPLGRILGHTAVVVLVLIAVLLPWYVRNWVVLGEPFHTHIPTVNKWQVCFQGGSAARLPIPDTEPGRRLLGLIGTPEGDVPNRHCTAVLAALESRGLSAAEADDLVTAVCLDAIREHPTRFAWPIVKRFLNFWRVESEGIPFYDGPRSFGDQRLWRVESVADVYDDVLTHTPSHWLRWNELVAAAAFAGILLMITRPRTRLVGLSLAVVCLYFAGVTSALEVENYRYRMVLEPLMILAVVCGAWALQPRFESGRRELRLNLGRWRVQVARSEAPAPVPRELT